MLSYRAENSYLLCRPFTLQGGIPELGNDGINRWRVCSGTRTRVQILFASTRGRGKVHVAIVRFDDRKKVADTLGAAIFAAAIARNAALNLAHHAN